MSNGAELCLVALYKEHYIKNDILTRLLLNYVVII